MCEVWRGEGGANTRSGGRRRAADGGGILRQNRPDFVPEMDSVPEMMGLY